MKNQLRFTPCRFSIYRSFRAWSKPGLCSFFIIFCCFTLHAQTCPPIIQWENSLGGSLDDASGSVTPTADGGYVAAGYTASINGDVIGNHGSEDFWVVKLAADGSTIWKVALGGTKSEVGRAVIQTADGGYVVAGSARSDSGQLSSNNGLTDFWVVKLDANGNLIWQNSLGGSLDDIAYDVNQTADGGYIVAGLTYSNDSDVTNNHGLDDYWVVKLDAGGNLSWEKTFGGTGSDQASSIEQTTDGGYIVAGFTDSNNGDVTGNQGLDDYWLVKLDSTGNLSWQKTFGGTKDDQAHSVQQTNDGGYIIGGVTFSADGNVIGSHGNSDFWIVKTDSTGVLVWQKPLGGSNFDEANSVEQTMDGGYVAAGNTFSNNGDVTLYHGGVDYWVTKQDSDGNLVWQKILGGTNYDGAFSVKETADTGFIVSGYSTSINDDVTGNNGLKDFWVVKLHDAPNTVITYFADVDGDSYGDPNNTIDTISCFPPSGYVTDNSDCNDNDSSIHPNAVETCNGIDDNCNGTADDGLIFSTYYADADGDLYGDSSNPTSTCNGVPVGYVINSTDCNDANSSIHPNAVEVCNGVDDNCNLLIDDGLPFVTYYVDADDDGYGNPLVTISTCNGAPLGYLSDSTDCDDSNPNVNPGVQEVSNNGIDDNCNGSIDEFGTGTGEIENTSSFMISPNPATSLLTLQLQLQSNSSFNAAITITNVLGEIVLEKASPCFNGILHEEISIDKKFPQGIYLVQVSNDNLKWSRLLMVMK